jgi:hypothetical protein
MGPEEGKLKIAAAYLAALAGTAGSASAQATPLRHPRYQLFQCQSVRFPQLVAAEDSPLSKSVIPACF